MQEEKKVYSTSAAASAMAIRSRKVAAISSAFSNTFSGFFSMSPGDGSNFLVDSVTRFFSKSLVRIRTFWRQPVGVEISRFREWTIRIGRRQIYVRFHKMACLQTFIPLVYPPERRRSPRMQRGQQRFAIRVKGLRSPFLDQRKHRTA